MSFGGCERGLESGGRGRREADKLPASEADAVVTVNRISLYGTTYAQAPGQDYPSDPTVLSRLTKWQRFCASMTPGQTSN